MNKNTKKNLFNMALAGAVATGSLVALAPTDVQAATKNFTDLKTDNVHYKDIMSLVERGVIAGYPDNTYKAGNSITRADAAVIIANILGLDTENVKDPGFKDLKKGEYYYGAVAALANDKIISGYGNGTYGVSDTLTRGQMAVILQKAFELEGEATDLPFTDAKGNFYESYISTLYVNGVTAGMTPTKYGVDSNVTRGQLATFVVKAEAVGSEVIVEIKDGQLVTNKGTYTIDAESAKVFNEENAAALKGARIKLDVENVAFASTTFFAAETPKLKIKSLTITAEGATFDAGGYTIPNVKVNGSNVVVKNVVADKIEVAEGLTVELEGVTAKEIALTGDTKIKLDATSKVEKLVVPAGKKVEDVISNFEEVKEIVKNIKIEDSEGTEVQPPGTTTPPTAGGGGGGGTGGGDTGSGGGSTQATAAESSVNSLISTIVTDMFADYGGTYGEFTDTTAPDFTFDFDDNYREVKLQVIKNQVQGSGSSIETDVVSLVNTSNVGHFLNISNITATSGGKESKVFSGIPENTELSDVKTYLESQLSQASVASVLSEFMDHDTARDATVSEFVGQFGTFTVTVTFRDGSTLPYTVNLED